MAVGNACIGHRAAGPFVAEGLGSIHTSAIFDTSSTVFNTNSAIFNTTTIFNTTSTIFYTFSAIFDFRLF